MVTPVRGGLAYPMLGAAYEPPSSTDLLYILGVVGDVVPLS